MSKPQDLDLRGHVLIAMPGMADDRFARSIVLLLTHTSEGAMGFILNKPIDEPTFSDVLGVLKLHEERTKFDDSSKEFQTFNGGPVEIGRGFVIHTLERTDSSSVRINDLAAVSGTHEILRAMIGDHPPEFAFLVLGYAGWGPGQLEDEISQNGWLTLEATHELVFETNYEHQYDAALAALGISEEALSASAGNA
ncbi:YqgE/AlgH family protein [Ahrensia sp. R2A130]|uniref:YqgE/AlgH family protein n=1 Tax=Ahrensia sp. R2A130 TaxID=744979 RepID=UPI0001E0D86D|nr:YqgE/AlgH family protein [Ahrensia sp. R2A130]EFL88893.1 conserved hypothetical protein [Ahrensia sp. R2A130]